MLKQIIETIDTKKSWGKNQLLNEIKPLVEQSLNTNMLFSMNLIKTSTINQSILDFEDYIKSKTSHGKIELKLALLDIIAKNHEDI